MERPTALVKVAAVAWTLTAVSCTVPVLPTDATPVWSWGASVTPEGSIPSSDTSYLSDQWNGEAVFSGTRAYPVGDGVIAVGEDGEIHLLRAADGHEEWATGPGQGWQATVVVNQSQVVGVFTAGSATTQAQQFLIERIDPETGAVVWKETVTDDLASPLEVDATGVSFVVVDNWNSEKYLTSRRTGTPAPLHPRLVRLAWADGAKLWTHSLSEITGKDDPIEGSQVTYTGTEFIVNTWFLYQGEDVAGISADGSHGWNRAFSSGPDGVGPAYSVLPLDANRVLLDSVLGASIFDSETGDVTQRWATGLASGSNAQEILVNGTLYSWSYYDRLVTATNVTSGAQVWSMHTEGTNDELGRHTPRGLSLQNGVLYLGSTDGDIYAIDPKTGHVTWKLPVADALLDPYPSPTVVDGRVILEEIGVIAYSTP